MKWEEANNKLREEFRFASDKCYEQKLISEEDRHKYYMSGKNLYTNFILK